MIRRLLLKLINKPSVLKVERGNKIIYITEEFTSATEDLSTGRLIVNSYGDAISFTPEESKQVKKFLGL